MFENKQFLIKLNQSLSPQRRLLYRQIKKRSHIVVGTPGRTKDLLNRKKLFIDKVQRVILDEADEMLSTGFNEQVYKILHSIQGLCKILQEYVE